MDWNLKAPAWELAELEQATISAVQGSSSCGDNKSRSDFSIDLKLGRVGNFTEEMMMDKWKEPRVASGSSKRPRAASNGAHTALCLVDGCNSDFSNCREYHRRHKVCEIHSKTPEVTIGGHKQRFCQQCSRFHSLEEFDEGKRSCRKRLDGHNRRRRKPQPEPMSHVGSFLSNYQGNQMMGFSSTQVYPCTSVMNPSWAVSVSSEEEVRQLYNQQQQLKLLDKQSSYLGSSSSSYNKDQALRRASICQPLLMSMALPESGDHNMFCDKLTNTVPYGDCALSLLSSPQSQTSGISLAHLVHPNSAPLAQTHHHHGLDPMDSVLVASGRDAYPANFHLPSHDSPPNTNNVPFHWE